MKAAATFAAGFVIATLFAPITGSILMVIGFVLWLRSEAHPNDE